MEGKIYRLVGKFSGVLPQMLLEELTVLPQTSELLMRIRLSIQTH